MKQVIKIMTARHHNHDVLACFGPLHVIKIMTSLLTMGTGLTVDHTKATATIRCGVLT